MANLQSILTWSLSQQGDGTRPSEFNRMDPERRRWLEEALKSVSSAPSETELLKAALMVLKAHNDSIPTVGGSSEVRQLSEEDVKTLESAFEQVQYFTEDLDHAKDLIPLDGVDVIIQYLHHPNHNLLQLSCELVATAAQNNPVCQQVFIPALSRLLEVVDNSSMTEGARVKALYAVSCITREYDPGLHEMLRLDGLSVLLHCLHSEVKKLVIKSLFMVMSYYSPATDPHKLLADKLTSLVSELVSILKGCRGDDELLGHVVSTLRTLVLNHPAAVEECQRAEHRLQDILQGTLDMWSPSEHKDEREIIEDVLKLLTDHATES